MNFYIAIDHKVGHKPSWTYIKITPWRNQKLTVREARNWFLRNQKNYDAVWCAHIMKRTKKDTYKDIETVYADGITYESNGPVDWITDYDFTETNTFTAE